MPVLPILKIHELHCVVPCLGLEVRCCLLIPLLVSQTPSRAPYTSTSGGPPY